MPKTNSETDIVGWKDVNWRKAMKATFKLQKRIYQASQSGDKRKVRKLQKTLLRSYHAKLLAIRKVSQENQGKKTAGVDGVKSLTPKQRFELVGQLKLKDKSKPVRRVWIPKANGEKRPLGILTMYDRAMQALVKAALEPEWEAIFEENSYGFRLGRGCHDAIEAIFLQIRYKSKFVLDADISKCFDQINQEALLEKLNTFPTLRKQIKAWLKAGVLMEGELFPTETGIPQGGVASPLLANIALHGMELLIKKRIKGTSLIRYADDLVLLHEDIDKVLRAKEILEEWLKEMGLELKPSKTRLVHTLHEYENQKAGFDFLGFNVRQYPVGKYQSGKNTNGEILGFKTIIRPSNEKVLSHYRKLAEIVDSLGNAPQAGLIKHINPVIRGWCNYYRTVCSKKTYQKLNHLLFLKIQRWAYRRHPNKPKSWVNHKYWHTIGQNTWTFAQKVSKEDKYIKLYTHPETAILRHIKVKGNKSPYDGDSNYWATRMGRYPDLSPTLSHLLKQQKGKCRICGLYFDEESVIEIDHILPKSLGGKDIYDNLQLLHRHCHHSKTAIDGSKTGSHESLNGEKPCEVKVSCTVLKTSRRGDTSA